MWLGMVGGVGRQQRLLPEPEWWGGHLGMDVLLIHKYLPINSFPVSLISFVLINCTIKRFSWTILIFGVLFILYVASTRKAASRQIHVQMRIYFGGGRESEGGVITHNRKRFPYRFTDNRCATAVSLRSAPITNIWIQTTCFAPVKLNKISHMVASQPSAF